MTRKSQWNPNIAYDDIPLLPPSKDIETRAVLKACIGARAAVGELKQAAALIPNQAMLINTLPLLEAQASSEIENIVTTADKLFQMRSLAREDDGATREALRYSHALLQGCDFIAKRPLSTRTAERICSIIKGQDMTIRRLPGTRLARTSGEIVYTPPVGEALLRSLLANWEKFLHSRDDLDPLIRMAAGHYQFEAIHPFTDGNGRTGRVLNSLFFVSEGLLSLPILYLSRYIIAHKAAYYRLLLGVTRNTAWEAWLCFLIEGVAETSIWTVRKIEAIRLLHERTAAYIRAQTPKIYSHELVNIIFSQPYCRLQNFYDTLSVSRPTGTNYIQTLVRLGLLEERRLGRDKIFIHSALMRLLTSDTNELPDY